MNAVLCSGALPCCSAQRCLYSKPGRSGLVVRSNLSGSSGQRVPSASRRSAVLSGLALVGAMLPGVRPGLAQTPDVTAEPSKAFVDSVLQDPEIRKRLGECWLTWASLTSCS